MQDIVFITGNQNKADFLAKHLGRPVEHRKLDLDEIQSLDPHTVVEHKVRQAYALVQQPVLVEDVSLVFTALGSLPGPFIKWFVESLGLPGLAKLANTLANQTAAATVCYAFCDGGEHVHFIESTMHGTIAPEPRGSGGFGFDAIFINDGFSKTRGDMTEQEYLETSYRTPAVAQLRKFLDSRGK